jgi:DNA-binding beta-propeller fold protein YncE
MRSLLIAAALGLPTLASAQIPGAIHILESRTFNTSGHPDEAIWTPDGQYVLVTVTRQHPLTGGIEVFHVEGPKLKRVAYEPLGDEPAEGILLIPNTRILAVGLSDAGVAFLSLDATLQGKAVPHLIPQGDRPGSGYLAATPDGATLFVANEYLHGGSVGVIAIRHDPKGQLAPEPIAQIPAPRATPGIAISPDGSRLYAVAEVLPEHWSERLPGNDSQDLRHEHCFQGPGSNPEPNGGLMVFDTASASAPPTDYSPQHNRDAILTLINAGCSPVRQVVSADGRTVYVTARGDNTVLVFDTAALEHDPAHAFLRAIDSGGEAPVGLALFDNDHKLLVANSNRFTHSTGNATVIDLADPANPRAVQTIHTGDFPRNITASPDGRTLLLSIYLGDELMLLTMK